MDKLFAVLNSFDIVGQPTHCQRYGCGHINDTYLAVTDTGHKYILQRINHSIFKDIDGLMGNIVGVTRYIIAKLEQQGKPTCQALRVIPTKCGKDYSFIDDNYYRVYNFIEDAISIEIPSNPHLMYLSGKGYGNFQNLLDGYPANSLTEAIPNFHNTQDRMQKFKAAIQADICGRVADVQQEINFYLARENYCGRITDLIKSGDVPLRVTHNDTKLNNVLIDLQKDIAATVIDLDTVMPGSIVYDFGDGIRSGTNTGAEDEKDLSKVGFSIEMFEGFAEGFLEEVGGVLTAAEVDNLAFGGILMTYECGMRFLTDYLDGDKYFRVHREGHNLDRTRTQIKMVTDMEQNIDDMNKIVRDYAIKNKNSR